MKQSDFDTLLNALDDESAWLPSSGLAGTSETLRDFVGQVVSTRSALAASSGDDCGIVVLVRSGATARLDSGLLSLLGFPPHETAIVELHQAADFFNQGQLFGVGTKKGVFENVSESAIVVRGVEYLGPTALQRLGVIVSVWRSHLRVPVVLLMSPNKHAISDPDVQKMLSPHALHLPALRHRPDDIPWAIHEAAKQHGGGLDQFYPDAVDLLLAHSWLGDVAEVDAVVSRLFSQANANSAIQFRPFDVKNALTFAGGIDLEMERAGAQQDVDAIWNSIHRLIDTIDDGTRRLLGVAFFATDAVPLQRAPFAGLWPELNFVKLISWAYIRFVEAASPNLRCVLRLMSGVNIQTADIQDVLDAIDRLRTLEQHQLQFSSERDMATIQRVSSWFERNIGREQPDEKDFEHCIHCLVLDIKRLLESVAKFIVRVELDEFRDVIIQQWQQMRDIQWERHRFEAIVANVADSLGRNDLNVRVITDKILPELQRRLSTCADDVDKPRVVAALVEEKFANDFPKLLPVTDDDVIHFGVPRGPNVGQILSKLKVHFAKTGASREELLQLAENLAGGEVAGVGRLRPPPAKDNGAPNTCGR